MLLSGNAVRIKSIQTSEIVINGATSATDTISIDDVNNAIILHNGTAGIQTEARYISTRVELTSETVVTAYKANATGAVDVRYTVIEFYPNTFKSIQRGTIQITNGNLTNTDTISIDDVSKAAIFHLGAAIPTANMDDALCHLIITSTTVVTAERNSSTDPVTVGYQVVEGY